MYFLKLFCCPDQRGSVDWTLSHRLKGHQFNPVQGTCLGCGFSSRSRYEKKPINSPLSFSPTLPLSLNIIKPPWPVWLSGLSVGLQNERSPDQVPVRAHAWVVGQAPTWGHPRGNQSMFLSLPPCFSKNT